VKKILVVDDEENLRVLIETTLDSPECQIIHACDGRAALDLAIHERPDLIILDWMMPSMTGIDVLHMLHTYPPTRDIPVLMLTARGQERDRQLASALGVHSYLIKPFSPLELLEKVQQALELSAVERRKEDESGKREPAVGIGKSA
jgi:two-component system, OmpR family, phosphate regulon response regulator PhoB